MQLPPLTEAVRDAFPINSDKFKFSLTPFILLFVWMGFTGIRNARYDEFWYYFAGIWMIVFSFIGVCIYALMAPLFLSLCVEDIPAIPWIPIISDICIIIAIVWQSLKKREPKS